MFTVSDIISDVGRCCLANNMNESEFLYRIIYFVNENGKRTKFYVDTSYDDLRKTLEEIVKGNLSTTNTLVIATITVRKNREAISLLSKSYSFSLNGYFLKICGEKREKIIGNYGRRKANWG